ncbi:zinc finger, CCHC-type containing protein [Tanacetum coccineum]
MGDENPIHTLGDYSRPSHKGYRNTIELPDGNNVVPLRSNTIQLVQNGCSFYGLWSEDPNQHLKDFLKLVDSLDLDIERLSARSISTWDDLTTCFLAQFFPLGRTAKLRNDILMFQQHQGESLFEAWTCFKDLLQKVPHHGNKVVDKNIIEPNKLDAVESLDSVDRKEEMKDRTDDASARSMKRELTEWEIKGELIVDRGHGLITFTNGIREVTFKTSYKDSERGNLTSKGHDLLSFRVILSKDDCRRGCERESDLERGFYIGMNKLGPSYKEEIERVGFDASFEVDSSSANEGGVTLYLMRRSPEALRIFTWMILG